MKCSFYWSATFFQVWLFLHDFTVIDKSGATQADRDKLVCR